MGKEEKLPLYKARGRRVGWPAVHVPKVLQPITACRAFGEVKQATWTRKDGKKVEVAIKCIPKKLVKLRPEVVYDEMDVLKDLHSDHVIKIYDWFECV